MRISIFFLFIIFIVSCDKSDDQIENQNEEILENEILVEEEMVVYTYDFNEIPIDDQFIDVEWEFLEREATDRGFVFFMPGIYEGGNGKSIKFSFKYEGTYTFIVKVKDASGQVLEDKIKIIAEKRPCEISSDLNKTLLYEDHFVDKGDWVLDRQISDSISFDNKLYMKAGYTHSKSRATKELSEFDIGEKEKLLFEIDISFLGGPYSFLNGNSSYTSHDNSNINIALFNKACRIKRGYYDGEQVGGLGPAGFYKEKLTIYMDLENNVFNACYKGEELSVWFNYYDLQDVVNPKISFSVDPNYEGQSFIYPSSLEINSLKIYKVEN